MKHIFSALLFWCIAFSFSFAQITWERADAGLEGGAITWFDQDLQGNLYIHAASGFWQSKDDGETWVLMNEAPPRFCFWGSDNAGNIYIGYESIFQSKDGGKTWQKITDYFADPQNATRKFHPDDMKVLPDGTIHVKYGYTSVYYAYSKDGGKTWQNSTKEAFALLNANQEGYIFRISSAKLERSKDALTWETILSNPDPTVYFGFSNSDKSTVLACRKEGLYRSFDSGTTWEPTNKWCGEMKFLANEKWQSGEYYTFDYGNTWTSFSDFTIDVRGAHYYELINRRTQNHFWLNRNNFSKIIRANWTTHRYTLVFQKGYLPLYQKPIAYNHETFYKSGGVTVRWSSKNKRWLTDTQNVPFFQTNKGGFRVQIDGNIIYDEYFSKIGTMEQVLYAPKQQPTQWQTVQNLPKDYALQHITQDGVFVLNRVDRLNYKLNEFYLWHPNAVYPSQPTTPVLLPDLPQGYVNVRFRSTPRYEYVAMMSTNPVKWLLFRSSNGGRSWQPYTPQLEDQTPLSPTIYSALTQISPKIFLGGDGRRNYISFNEGDSWEVLPFCENTATESCIQPKLMDRANRMWGTKTVYNTDANFLYHSRLMYSDDTGKTWYDANLPIKAVISEVFMDADGHVYVSTWNGLFRTVAPSQFVQIANETPLSFATHAAFPNPFSSRTTLSVSLAQAGKLSVVVYNALGQRIHTLSDTEMPAGMFKFDWDASSLPSGVYFARIEANGNTKTEKLVVMR